MPPIRRHVNPESGDNSEIRAVDSSPKPTKLPLGDASGMRASLRASSIPPSGGSLPLSREARIEQKVAEAELRLRELRADDSRARLLQAAVMRRDEGLLDAILQSLEPNRG